MFSISTLTSVLTPGQIEDFGKDKIMLIYFLSMCSFDAMSPHHILMVTEWTEEY